MSAYVVPVLPVFTNPNTGDDFSGTPTPLQAPESFSVVGQVNPVPAAAGDVSLAYLLSFFATVANANAAGAWNATGIAPGVPVVKTIVACDPDDCAISDAWLPALFLWHEGYGRTYKKADDYLVRESSLRMLWIPPTPQGQNVGQARSPFGGGLHAILVEALDKMRDKSWVVVGDPNPTAAQHGSIISDFVKFYYLVSEDWKPVTYADKTATQPISYRGWGGKFDMLELKDKNLSRFDAWQGGLILTLQSATTPPLIMGRSSNT